MSLNRNIKKLFNKLSTNQKEKILNELHYSLNDKQKSSINHKKHKKEKDYSDNFILNSDYDLHKTEWNGNSHIALIGFSNPISLIDECMRLEELGLETNVVIFEKYSMTKNTPKGEVVKHYLKVFDISSGMECFDIKEMIEEKRCVDYKDYEIFVYEEATKLVKDEISYFMNQDRFEEVGITLCCFENIKKDYFNLTENEFIVYRNNYSDYEILHRWVMDYNTIIDNGYYNMVIGILVGDLET